MRVLSSQFCPSADQSWVREATISRDGDSAMIQPAFVDHVVLRVAELDRTERFYTTVLGQTPRRAEGSLMYQLGDTRLFFTLSDRHQQEPYDKEKVGLNHVAFGVRAPEDLQAIRARLNSAGISNSGIKLDHYGQKEFLWLDDPADLRIELHLQ